MTGSQRLLEFGIALAPDTAGYPAQVELATLADSVGLDLVGVQDHPYQSRFVDTFTLLTNLALATERVRVFPDVSCLPLRPPAMMAKAAASIDAMSGGRFELGVGAGAFWDAIVAMGGSRRSPSAALAALREAIEIIRLMWSGQPRITFSGSHYSVSGLHPGPVPAHDIEIWLGVIGPRALKIVGEMADGWLPSIGPVAIEDLRKKHDIIDEAASESGRDPADIRRLVNAVGEITSGPSSGFLHGSEEQWVDQVMALVEDQRIDTIIFAPQTDAKNQVQRYAEVANRVRELAQQQTR